MAKVRGVYEHPKGSEIWWIQYFDHGRRRRERVGRKSDAIKLYQKRKTQILQGDKLPELQRKRVTFGDLLDDLLAYAREHNLVMRNYDWRVTAMRKGFGTVAAEKITAAELREWISKQCDGAASANRWRAFVSAVYREGVRSGKVTTNPAKKLAGKREPRGRQRFLSRPEYAAVLAAIRATCPEREPDFVISIHTGMRLSEQHGLRWKHVDLERREVEVVDSKNGDDRTIPLDDDAYAAFRSLLPEKVKRTAKVFVRKRGGESRIAARWFTDMLASEELGLGIDDYTWHNNRHTFCSWLAIGGAPLKTIQELAGHRTIAMTARYSHLSPDHKRAEITKLSSGPKVLKFEQPTATRTATA